MQSPFAARRRRAVLALAATALIPLVHAADEAPYPSRPLTIVVPSVAGNVNDAVARLLGQELTKAWGQPVIVDNKPGAGTTTGTKFVAQAPKDGYTALLTFTAHVQNPPLFPTSATTRSRTSWRSAKWRLHPPSWPCRRTSRCARCPSSWRW